jgi:hypothetical protein
MGFKKIIFICVCLLAIPVHGKMIALIVSPEVYVQDNGIKTKIHLGDTIPESGEVISMRYPAYLAIGSTGLTYSEYEFGKPLPITSIIADLKNKPRLFIDFWPSVNRYSNGYNGRNYLEAVRIETRSYSQVRLPVMRCEPPIIYVLGGELGQIKIQNKQYQYYFTYRLFDAKSSVQQFDITMLNGFDESIGSFALKGNFIQPVKLPIHVNDPDDHIIQFKNCHHESCGVTSGLGFGWAEDLGNVKKDSTLISNYFLVTSTKKSLLALYLQALRFEQSDMYLDAVECYMQVLRQLYSRNSANNKLTDADFQYKLTNENEEILKYLVGPYMYNYYH